MVDLQCRYCGQQYKRQVMFERHTCRNKSLAEQYGEIDIFQSYELFRFWYQYNGFSKRKAKSMEDFLKSPYFKEFVNLHESLKGIYLFNHKDFIVWLNEKKIGIDSWHKNTVIERYKKEHSKRGRGIDQFLKSVENIVLWCDIRNLEHQSFFENIPINEALLWVQSGKLSPWHLLLSEKGSKLMDRMTDDQLEYLLSYIDVTYWDARFKVAEEDVKEIKNIIEEMDF